MSFFDFTANTVNRTILFEIRALTPSPSPQGEGSQNLITIATFSGIQPKLARLEIGVRSPGLGVRS
jgi:hypothetical protein